MSDDLWVANYAGLSNLDGRGAAHDKVSAIRRDQRPTIPTAGSSLLATTVNVTKGVVGAGMLSLPLALHRGSTLLGASLLISFGFIAASSYVLLAYCCEATGAATYYGLWSRTLGRDTAWMVQISILVNNIFTLWAFTTLVADFVNKAMMGLFPNVGLLHNRLSILIFAGGFVLAPLSFPRHVDSLKYSSALGILASAYSCAFVCSQFAGSGVGSLHLSQNLLAVRPDLFRSLALFAFSFQSHYGAPRVYYELARRSVKRIAVASFSAYSMAILIYCTFALCGYGLFGSAVQGNMLKNFDQGSTEVLLMWVMMSLSVMFSYPLIFAALKENVYGLLNLQEEDSSFQFRGTVVIIGVSSSVVLGAACKDASLVMGICGSLVGAAVEFGFPALIYLHLPEDARMKGFGTSAALATLSYGLLCVAFTVAVIGLAATILEEFRLIGS